MTRALPLAVALVAIVVLPATAGAADWRGVVIAKDSKRQSVVTASQTGVVRTVRAPGKLRALKIGQRVVVKARPLADGTFGVQTIRGLARARQARLRATVVRHQARAAGQSSRQAAASSSSGRRHVVG